MDERDRELDALLAPLRKVEPSELESARWRRALRRPPRPRWWVQMTAAAAIGFAIGAFVFHSPAPENWQASATIDHVYAKAR